MGDTVRLRPNHYELLGLTPAATVDEIAQAFSKQLNLIPFRPFGWLAQISIAYETLRDPAKRKAYDVSLSPRPAVKLSGHPVMAQLFRTPPGQPTKQPAATPLPAAPAPAARDEWKPAPPAAIQFKERHPAASEAPPRPAPTPEEMIRQSILNERRRQAAPQPLPRHDRPESPGRNSEARTDWKIPAIAAGALVVAVVGGAWMGLEAGNDDQPVQSERSATLKVPPAGPAPEIEAPPSTDAAISDSEPRQQRAADIAAPVERARAPLQIELPDEQPVEGAQAPPEQPVETVAEQVAPESLGIAAGAAGLPLPNAVVARTIRRIGYPCGQVATTAAIDGEAAGTFKVTCTSGHSYRAAPVRGRYHFRRMGGR